MNTYFSFGCLKNAQEVNSLLYHLNHYIFSILFIHKEELDIKNEQKTWKEKKTFENKGE